jgi:hypothetical protein
MKSVDASEAQRCLRRAATKYGEAAQLARQIHDSTWEKLSVDARERALAAAESLSRPRGED